MLETQFTLDGDSYFVSHIGYICCALGKMLGLQVISVTCNSRIPVVYFVRTVNCLEILEIGYIMKDFKRVCVLVVKKL